jgi:hypothetical protein
MGDGQIERGPSSARQNDHLSAIESAVSVSM